jgi:tetratricopeptide (TPR) repeat protein
MRSLFDINAANAINNLGNTYYHQGKYDEATAHYERTLEIREKADHINTANAINNLGLTYNSQGKYDEAISRIGSHQHGRHDQQPRPAHYVGQNS